MLSSHPLTIGMAILRQTNVARRFVWHEGVEPWSGADWSNEMCGEAGEAANYVKKLRRIETGVRQRGPRMIDELRGNLGCELADVVICADLLGAHYDLPDLGTLIVGKFNADSEKRGFEHLL